MRDFRARDREEQIDKDILAAWEWLEKERKAFERKGLNLNDYEPFYSDGQFSGWRLRGNLFKENFLKKVNEVMEETTTGVKNYFDSTSKSDETQQGELGDKRTNNNFEHSNNVQNNKVKEIILIGRRNHQSEKQAGVHNESEAKTGEHTWNERSEGQAWYEVPHEQLVGIIKNKLDQKRAEYEREGYSREEIQKHFDPVARISREFPRHTMPHPFKVNRQVLDLERVWDSVSLPYIKSADYRDTVESILKDEAASRRSSKVTLEPKAVKFLDVMADACGIKRPRGEVTFDLMENVRLTEADEVALHPQPGWRGWRPLILDGEKGYVSPLTLDLPGIKGKKIKGNSGEGWFYPYPRWFFSNPQRRSFDQPLRAEVEGNPIFWLLFYILIYSLEDIKNR